MQVWMPRRPKEGRKRTREEKWWSRPLALAPPVRGTLSAMIADEIRRRILLGSVKPGQRLESYRTLARELDVAVGTVREAMAELRAEGLVDVRHGVGVFVRRRRKAARSLRAARRRASRHELRDLLRAVEPFLAEAAARRGSPRQLRDLRMALWERQRAGQGGDARAFAESDAVFHRLIANASGNALAASAHGMASLALRPDVTAKSAALAADPELNGLHEQLVDAILDGRWSRARGTARLITAQETQPP